MDDFLSVKNGDSSNDFVICNDINEDDFGDFGDFGFVSGLILFFVIGI